MEIRALFIKYYTEWFKSPSPFCPPLWARQQHVHLSCSEPRFDPQSGQVSWVRFFWGFSSPVRQMSGSFRPPRSPNIIWPSLSSSLIIHYGCQWPEMLTCPTTLNIHKYTYHSSLNLILQFHETPPYLHPINLSFDISPDKEIKGRQIRWTGSPHPAWASSNPPVWKDIVLMVTCNVDKVRRCPILLVHNLILNQLCL